MINFTFSVLVLVFLLTDSSLCTLQEKDTKRKTDTGRKKTLKELVQDLDTIGAIRDDAYDELWNLGPKAAEAVPFLIERFKKKRDFHSVLLFAKIGPASKGAIPVLLDLVKARIEGGPEDPEDLMFAESKYGPWEYCVKALGAIGPEAKAAVPYLIKVIDDPNPKIRADVCDALGKIRADASKAVPALIRLLDDKNVALGSPFRYEVRRSAIVALGKFGPASKDAVAGLIQNIKDADMGVRCDCIEALGEIGPAAGDAVPALIKALNADEKYEKFQAIISIGKIGPNANAALPALRAIVKTNAMPFSSEAEKAILKIEKKKQKRKRCQTGHLAVAGAADSAGPENPLLLADQSAVRFTPGLPKNQSTRSIRLIEVCGMGT